VIHHATRAVAIAGVTTTPDAAFMAQVARNITDEVGGFLRGTRYLILDLDTKFTDQFQRILQDAGVEVVRTAYQTPNMNAFAERWVLSVKSECLDRMIFLGEASLRRAFREYDAHFNPSDRTKVSATNSSLQRRMLAPPPSSSSTNASAESCGTTTAQRPDGLPRVESHQPGNTGHRTS